MRHYLIARVSTIIAFTFLIATTAAAQQMSLGDLAREAKKNKPTEPTTRVITNDDLGVLTTSRTTDAEPNTTNDNSGADKTKPEEKKSSADDQAKLDKEWSSKFASQKDQIALMERELQVLQR